MLKRFWWNDLKQNKLISAALIFFMTISPMLLSLGVLLFSGLLGSIENLMENARVPDLVQMHSKELNPEEISRFAEEHEEIEKWQICSFLNLDNSRLFLGEKSLRDSTQDNGLCMQGEQFDFLLDMDGRRPKVLPGQVYVPVCYRTRYALSAGDVMRIGESRLVIAGFIRDAQMNSMMSSSKRFLVNEEDYGKLKGQGEEEYLIEFLLRDGADEHSIGKAYAAQGLPAGGPAITKPLIRMMNALSDGTVILVIFLVSLVVLLVSVLCIRFILALQMQRERKEMGMLKALGFGKKDMMRIYFSRYLLLSGCGAWLGLIAAELLKRPLAKQLRELYGVADRGHRAETAGILTVLATEAVLLLFIRWSLKRTEKMSALDALFAAQEKKTGRGQYGLIGFVTAACGFLMLVPQNLYTTLSSPQFVTYMGIGSGEIRMDLRQAGDTREMTARIAAELEGDIQVKSYAALETRAVLAVLPDGSRENLSVEMGDHSIFPVSFSEGTFPVDETEIALSALNAKELGLSVGDILRLPSEGGEADYRVCGIYSDITNGGKTAKMRGGPETGPVIWSVFYVSLTESADKELWMETYRRMGADVTDIGNYVRDTYAQTLGQLGLASDVAFGMAAAIIGVVVMLFMRLNVEQNRGLISLHKALGFTGRDMKRSFFRKGFLSAAAGCIAGIGLGNLWGEGLCGKILEGFGADGFRFVIVWERMLVLIPAVLLGVSAAAVWIGIAKIGEIKAYECCRGRE